MKKKIVLLLLPLLLSGCNRPSNVSEYVSNETISLSTFQSNSISDEEEINSTFILSEGSVSSSAENITDSEIEYDEVNFTGDVLDYSYRNQYAEEAEYEVDGKKFILNYVQQNTGKYSVPCLQFKKLEGKIRNIDPIAGKLTITIYINTYHDYKNDVDVDATILPTIYAGNEIDNLTKIDTKNIVYSLSEDGLKKIYNIESSINYSYFSFVNESNNAVYLDSIIWHA